MFNYNDEIVKEDLKDLYNLKLDYNILKNKSILITGANSMIATYLSYYFMYLNDNANTNIKLYLLSRDDEKLQKKFVNNLNRNDIVSISQDVTKKINIEEKLDYIIHMASSASPKIILEDPISIIEANILGTLNILNLARKNNSEVIFTSTREIYGKMNDNINKISEDDMGVLNCFDQRACYPESKRLAETILVNYNYQYGIDFKNLRIAHVFGPGMNIKNDGRVMSDFICDVVNNRDIVLKSKGDAKRAFCYITDAISGILHVMLKGTKNQSYNISNETEEISISDLANLIASISSENNIKVKYELNSDQRGYTKFKRVALDTTKLESLGWKPKVKLKDGIIKTVNSYKNEL